MSSMIKSMNKRRNKDGSNLVDESIFVAGNNIRDHRTRVGTFIHNLNRHYGMPLIGGGRPPEWIICGNGKYRTITAVWEGEGMFGTDKTITYAEDYNAGAKPQSVQVDWTNLDAAHEYAQMMNAYMTEFIDSNNKGKTIPTSLGKSNWAEADIIAMTRN